MEDTKNSYASRLKSIQCEISQFEPYLKCIGSPYLSSWIIPILQPYRSELEEIVANTSGDIKATALYYVGILNLLKLPFPEKNTLINYAASSTKMGV